MKKKINIQKIGFPKEKDYKTEIYEEMVNKIPNKETSLKVKRDDFIIFLKYFLMNNIVDITESKKTKKKNFY